MGNPVKCVLFFFTTYWWRSRLSEVLEWWRPSKLLVLHVDWLLWLSVQQLQPLPERKTNSTQIIHQGFQGNSRVFDFLSSFAPLCMFLGLQQVCSTVKPCHTLWEVLSISSPYFEMSITCNEKRCHFNVRGPSFNILQMIALGNNNGDLVRTVNIAKLRSRPT